MSTVVGQCCPCGTQLHISACVDTINYYMSDIDVHIMDSVLILK